jgi:allophanate hydrolase subunit 2
VSCAGPAWVVDLGAAGWAWAGFARGGAADPAALVRANRALGNPSDAAGIELYGAIRGRLADGRRWATGDGVVSDAPEVAVAAAGGARWVAIEGGIDVPMVLGSRSTRVAVGLGGFEGRGLRSGDRLPLGARHGAPGRLGWVEARDATAPIAASRAPGAPEGTWTRLLAGRWRVGPDSDRTGLRLDGAPIPGGGALAASVPVGAGAVELPPDGRPIVLGPDHPTTGGYPVVAVVTREGLAALYRRGPGADVAFIDVASPRGTRTSGVARLS